MDISLIRTFLELNRTRHFGKTAKALYITQSAVSARIRMLEETLGVTLLTRDRNNLQLTPAGMRFLKHAENMINIWNRAQQETALQDESITLLTIGAAQSLWATSFTDLLQSYFRSTPDTALVMESHPPEALLRRLQEGAIDVAFMFESPQVTDLKVEEIGNMELVLVSSHANISARDAASAKDYIMVDWGTAFATRHASEFSDIPPPTIRAGLGLIALGFLRSGGGSAYLAKSMVKHLLDQSKLHLVEDAPVIQRQIYAVYMEQSSRQPWIQAFNQSLRHDRICC